MDEISSFKSEDEYLDTARLLQNKVNSGLLTEVAPNEEGPFLCRRFVDNKSREVWVFALPDQSFRGYLRREGKTGMPSK